MSSDADRGPPGRQVGHVLAEAATAHPDRVALEVASADGSVIVDRLTYLELHHRACRVAEVLQGQGIVTGDAVALQMTNSVGLVASWFGVVYAGAAVVPLSVKNTPREVQVRCDFARAKLLLTSEPASLGEQTAGTERGPALEPLSSWPQPVAADATAMLLYTSGTTGAPKAACIGHRSLLLHTRALVRDVLGLAPNDRVLGVLPMSHSYGCRMTLLATFMAGARTLLMERFSASGSLRAMKQHGVTWCPGVPTMFAAWAVAGDADRPEDAAPRDPPSSLRWCLSAGASLSEAVRCRAEAALGCEIRQGYGMTEATFSTVDHPPEPARPGTVGRPVPGVQVRIVRRDGQSGAARAVAAADEVGDIEVRGPNVMQGYLRASEATATLIRNGWVSTGDLGSVSTDGWLTVTGRSKDVILRGGVTIYPAEVEEVLVAVHGVNDAAVVGQDDAFYGERVCAVVVADAGLLGALRSACEASLAPHKRPTSYAFVAALPQGASGKVLKRELATQLAQGILPLANA